MGRAGSGPEFHVNSGSGWVTSLVGWVGSRLWLHCLTSSARHRWTFIGFSTSSSRIRIRICALSRSFVVMFSSRLHIADISRRQWIMSECQLISVIITTLIIYHSFTLSFQARNLPFQQILPTLDFFYLPDCLHDNGTGPNLSCSSFYF